MDSLSREEVLHIADLAMLDITEEEIDKYSIELKTLFNEINKVKNASVSDEELMFSPSEMEMTMFNDEYIKYGDYMKLIENAPQNKDNFIEVAGVFDE